MAIDRPLVVGAPRSGFSLLIAVIQSIQHLVQYESQRPARDFIMRGFVDLTSRYITSKYKETFAKHGITDNLVFNGEFHLLVGGPKWLDKDNPELASTRKYFGAKGMGDFLLITSHPKEVFEYYSVIHSHTAPKLWLEHPYYEPFKKFTSVRNPIGIINSATFSLNAMTSEYIQKFAANEDENVIRQRLALYKLTDLKVVEGLVNFLKNYLDEFLPLKEQYFIMKWENLISNPVQTIKIVASELGVEINDDMALAIWQPIDHKNLLEHHKHNYRRGKGIVGDWKNSLVNEHIDIFREFGFETYLKELGYPTLQELDPRGYSPFQKLIARHIQRGEVYPNTGDPDIFTFAFNKSNIDASKFNFKSFPKKQWTHVERSTFSDDSVVEDVSETAEQACSKINNILLEMVNSNLNGKQSFQTLVRSLDKRCSELIQDCADVSVQSLHNQIFQSLYSQLQ